MATILPGIQTVEPWTALRHAPRIGALRSVFRRLWYRCRRPPNADDTIAQCEAYLSGRYTDWLAERGEPVPGWAWVNRLAHGSRRDIAEAAAADGSVDEREQLVTELARKIESTAHSADISLIDLQRSTLIPLESRLRAVFGSAVPKTGAELAAWVRAALGHGARHRSRDGQQ